jgi:hypothetical protein
MNILQEHRLPSDPIVSEIEKERKNGKNLNVQRKSMDQKGTKTNLRN